MLLLNLFKCAEKNGYKKIVLAGGVAANSELRRRLTTECKNRGYELFMPPLSLCGDNAAMVGVQGYYEYLSGNVATESLNAYATLPINENKK